MKGKVQSSISKNAIFEVSLKIILKNKKGEVLLLKAPSKSSLFGSYDLLGGRIGEKEIGGSFKKIIDREVREEIGKEVKFKLNEKPVAIGRHYYFSKQKRKIQYIFLVLFEATYIGGKLKISSEHTGYRWLKLNKNNYKKYFIKGSLEGMSNYILGKFVSS